MRTRASPRTFMFQQLFDATRIAIEAGLMLQDEDKLREVRAGLMKLFEAQGVPFTTDTLNACLVGMGLVLFNPDRAHSRHFMAGLRAIIEQRKEVEAKANI